MKGNFFAIIPARGGSKRLKDKNIYPLLGKPLIQYTIDEALKSKYINNSNLYVSTEDDKIKMILSKDIRRINRPSELSEDHIWTQDVINHFTKELKINKDDIIIILQANSPQIKATIIDQCIEKLINQNLWQVHTVDNEYINNGAIHVVRKFIDNHKGKVNYNGVVQTDWIDVHTIEDVKAVESLIHKQ